MMNATVPSGFIVRAPTLDDLEAVTDLINTCVIAEYGAPEYTTDELRSDWEWAGFTLATDGWLIVSPDGQLAGYAAMWIGPIRLFGEVYVQPEQRGRGIGSCLLERIETRGKQHAAQALANASFLLMQEINVSNEVGKRLLEKAGYTISRHNWRMEITLVEAPPAPVWPAGIMLRHFAPGQDERAIHATTEEAFQHNRGFSPTPFEHWAQTMIRHEWHDPSLWFIAMDGTELAGVALCRKHHMQTEMGWVNILAVRAPWRQKGLGMALLQQAFGEFYRRAIRQVGLSVDSENITGATRLYEQAGMRVTRQYDRYQKELRPDLL